MKSRQVAFVVPAFNENSVLEQTISPLLKIGEVVVVDDGSFSPILLTHPTLDQVHYLKHLINRGQGAAIETGFSYILQHLREVKYIVTFDADGQHNPDDCFGMIETAQHGFDVVLGSRFLAKGNKIPLAKKLVLKGFAWLYSSVKRQKFTDRHFGLRVLSRSFVENSRLQMSGFEHADEILDLIVKGKWKYCEYPASVSYTDYSKSKGQPMINGLNILFNRLFSKL